MESIKAKMSAEQLAEMRQRAERYVDESDDIEYFAGKTREEQLKDLEAKQRADVEASARGARRRFGKAGVPEARRWTKPPSPRE